MGEGGVPQKGVVNEDLPPDAHVSPLGQDGPRLAPYFLNFDHMFFSGDSHQ